VAVLVVATAVAGLVLAQRSTRLSRGGGRTVVVGFAALVASIVLLAASYPAIRGIQRYRTFVERRAADGSDGNAPLVRTPGRQSVEREQPKTHRDD
jgi:hypothetical protein